MPEIRRPRPPYASKEQQIAALYNHVDYDKHIERLNKTVRSWDVPIQKPPEIPSNKAHKYKWRHTADRTKPRPSSIEWLSNDAREAWNLLEYLQKDRRKYTLQLAKITHELAHTATSGQKALKKQQRTLEQQIQENTKQTTEYKEWLLTNRPDIIEEHRKLRLAKRDGLSDAAKANLKVHDRERHYRPKITSPKPSTSAPKSSTSRRNST